MRIDSIYLKNYRQYKDLTISFYSRNDSGLSIIVGTNGAGKTNLLNAINWCLYGDEPNLRDKSKALPIVNLDTLDSLEPGSNIQTEVEIRCREMGGLITYKRSKTYKLLDANSDPRELSSQFEVITQLPGKETQCYQGEQTQRWLNRFAPHMIREYFFFDGERLGRYFVEETSSRIKDAVFEISQIRLLETVSSRLDILYKDLINVISKNSPDLDQKYEALEVAQTTVSTLNDRIKNLKEQIKVSVEAIEQISEFLGAIPDIESLESERVNLKDKQKRLESTLANKKDQFFSLVKWGFILLQSRKAIEYSEDKIKLLRSSGQLPPRFDRNYLLEFINNGQCGICGTNLDSTSSKRVYELLNQIDYSTQTTHQLSKLETSLKYLLENLSSLGQKLAEARMDLDGTRTNLEEVIERLHNIDLIVGSYSDKELIKQKYDTRRNHEILKAENLRLLGNVEAQLSTASKDLELKENALNKALKAVNQSEQAKEKQEFLEKVFSVAKAAKENLLIKTKDSIQNLTTKTFLRLIWKKNTYREVVLDENYSLSLKQMNGMESLGSVSAAEGALLALSFTLAIHGASGFSSPLIIDTPIARISDINKDNFAKVLLEISKEKQLILFLTPDEYTPKIQAAFEPSISTKYYLRLSQDETITTLEGR